MLAYPRARDKAKAAKSFLADSLSFALFYLVLKSRAALARCGSVKNKLQACKLNLNPFALLVWGISGNGLRTLCLQ